MSLNSKASKMFSLVLLELLSTVSKRKSSPFLKERSSKVIIRAMAASTLFQKRSNRRPKKKSTSPIAKLDSGSHSWPRMDRNPSTFHMANGCNLRPKTKELLSRRHFLSMGADLREKMTRSEFFNVPKELSKTVSRILLQIWRLPKELGFLHLKQAEFTLINNNDLIV